MGIDLPSIIEEAELFLFTENHQSQCACSLWPKDCITFPGGVKSVMFSVNAESVILAAAPLIEQAVREQVAADIEASIVRGEARYAACACSSGAICHPHACHTAINRVTSRADEDTWPVHIAGGVWNELDPLIRRHAAAIARGEVLGQ